MTCKRKMEETAMVSLTWLFILLTILLWAISCRIKINLHTLVILSFTEEFRTIFRLRQKELEKILNRPAKLNNEFESSLQRDFVVS